MSAPPPADVDYRGTRQAGRNRQAKILGLVTWCVRHGVTGTELAGLAPALRNKIARAAGVNPPHDPAGETWQAVLGILADDDATAAGLAARPDWLPALAATTALARSLLACTACERIVRWVSGPPAPDDERARPTLIALDPMPLNFTEPGWAVNEGTLVGRRVAGQHEDTPMGQVVPRYADHATTCEKRPRARAEEREQQRAAAGGVWCAGCGGLIDPVLLVDLPRGADPDLHPGCTRPRPTQNRRHR